MKAWVEDGWLHLDIDSDGKRVAKLKLPPGGPNKAWVRGIIAAIFARVTKDQTPTDMLCRPGIVPRDKRLS